MGVGFVVNQLKVIEIELINLGDVRIDLHLGKWQWISGELEVGLVKMVRVKVKVAKSMDKFPRLVAANLCDHHGEEGIGGDVERDSEEKVCAALIELTAQAGTIGVWIVNVELKEKVAGW